MSVTEIHNQLRIEQAVASHHLRILKDRKVVSSTREGKHSLYHLTKKDFYQIVETLSKVV